MEEVSKLTILNNFNLEIYHRISPYFSEKSKTLTIPDSIESIKFNGRRLEFKVGDVTYQKKCNIQKIVDQYDALSIFKVNIEENGEPDLGNILQIMVKLDSEDEMMTQWKYVLEEIQAEFGQMESFLMKFEGLEQFVMDCFGVEDFSPRFVVPKTSAEWKFSLDMWDLSQERIASFAKNFFNFFEIQDSIKIDSMGYTTLAADYFQINDRMALCAMNNNSNKSWEEIYSVCNEEQGYGLASSGIMQIIGAPEAEDWDEARRYFLDLGYTHVITGQLARRHGRWEDGANDYQGKTFGLIPLSDSVTSPNWRDMTDGNSNPNRSWHYANTYATSENLVTLSVNASDIPGAFKEYHIWRTE